MSIKPLLVTITTLVHILDPIVPLHIPARLMPFVHAMKDNLYLEGANCLSVAVVRDNSLHAPATKQDHLKFGAWINADGHGRPVCRRQTRRNGENRLITLRQTVQWQKARLHTNLGCPRPQRQYRYLNLRSGQILQVV